MSLKRVVCVIVILISVFSIFADNLQKTYLLTDELWLRTNRLCISTGHLGPSPVSPTTGAEIKQALERLDYNSLSSKQKSEYDAIMAEIEDSTVNLALKSKYATIDPEITVSVEGYAFNNLKNTQVDEFFVPYRDRRPLLNAGVDAFFGDFAYLKFQYMFKDGPQGFYINDSGSVSTGYNNNQSFFYNFSNFGFLISPALDGTLHYFGDGRNKYRVVTYQPFEAGGSFGNEFFNFFIGRSRQEFGNGVTGNMIIGDNFSYQEIAKLSFFSDVFSYYLSLTHFDNPEVDEDFRFSGLHQNRLIHRFDFNLFNKVRITINVGAQMLTDSPFDLRMLNPMMIAHNWNNNSENYSWSERNGDEINNIFGFEFEYAALPGLMFSAQFVLDQAQIYGEGNSVVPSAMGVLANMKYIASMTSGYCESYIEGAYTSPYLYLNYKQFTEGENTGKPNYMLDHIVGYSYSQNNYSEIGYSGYSYGPNAFVLSAGTEYSSFDDWSVNASVLYMAHGINGKEYWRNKSNLKEFEEYTCDNVTEHTLNIIAGAAWTIIDNLELYGAVSATFKWNYMNMKDEFKDFYQAAIGLSWTII